MLHIVAEYMLNKIIEWSLMGVTREKHVEMEREKKFLK